MVAQLIEMALIWGLRGCFAWYVAHEYILAVNQKFGAVLQAFDSLN